MKNIIVSGCSYSQKSGVPTPYPDVLNTLDYLNVKNLSWPGQSNDTIIRDIKDELETGIENTLFICQLTHLHRVTHFCTINKRWLDFQPAIINPKPTIKNNKVQFEIDFSNYENNRNIYGGNGGAVGVKGAQRVSELGIEEDVTRKLLDWYETYLMYLYDEEHTFYELHRKISELTSIVESTNNEIIYLYWPDIIYDESVFEQNDFLKIDENYSMLKWSVKNKLTKRKDSHLSLNGHYTLATEILKKLGVSHKFVMPII